MVLIKAMKSFGGDTRSHSERDRHENKKGRRNASKDGSHKSAVEHRVAIITSISMFVIATCEKKLVKNIVDVNFGQMITLPHFAH